MWCWMMLLIDLVMIIDYWVVIVVIELLSDLGIGNWLPNLIVDVNW